MKKGVLLLLLAGVFAMSAMNSSCKKSDDNTTTMTLYDSLGGTTMVQDPANTSTMIEKGRLGIRSVVDSAIFVIAADNQLNGFFTVLLAEVTSGNTTGFEALSKNLTDFICVAAGAKNFTYGGKNMVAAHDPAQNSRMNGKATSANFDQFLNDVGVAAKKCGLSDQLIGQVAARLNTVRSQVVQQ
ncbi:globin family protein [Taibaiella soli]|uniref:Group 1 truncated hemoglobin n=1 Tax=Taibaiella soli TaxID=1649169 RepID=A0A2W2BLQ5_9BACT|nr:group 1 truncated hemoglobin [Taibaiella soli]PZF74366.1 group 1 truncated hemoglobin [Taibaiella soli]